MGPDKQAIVLRTILAVIVVLYCFTFWCISPVWGQLQNAGTAVIAGVRTIGTCSWHGGVERWYK